ncbi:bromodomain-containing protein [Biomphalaria glabrata]|uniref:Smr domain-containing protein n=1 Tax=Biomphalaria glabrata TaxID=6526 RepID=A0A2C9M8P9_BIOGL|nr:bromodomain-containing protein [Biomphalaria glabrata]
MEDLDLTILLACLGAALFIILLLTLCLLIKYKKIKLCCQYFKQASEDVENQILPNHPIPATPPVRPRIERPRIERISAANLLWNQNTATRPSVDWDQFHDVTFPQITTRRFGRERDPDKTIDLHRYTVREAIFLVKDYLRLKQNDYKNSCYNENHRYINIVTGRGLHSKDGIPRIKLAVNQYLEDKGYNFQWVNAGGMVIVDLASTTRAQI